MARGEHTRKWLWRWKKNPLRRRDDVVEAWIVLAVWGIVALGGTAAGLVTALAGDAVFTRQRAERQPVGAVLLNDAPRTVTALGTTTDHRPASVRWTTPGGYARTGRTQVSTGLKAGAEITVWQDRQGRLALAPPSSSAAAVESGFLGTTAALALAGIVFGAGAVVRHRLDRRRIDGWADEWDLVGPRWSHRTG
ncbi:Rv1733c family protein [Streptomyces rhizosphaerihabitans]|uniref:Rv1733c family protein n=1 Tax=Streptomyces rhizosphaerihabitans TaxID=1266770 RepID=UPI0021C0ED73|nr:hypothetical protein [Streptomyces rhizosphaerihabitans]MCT9011440.1 hypothetical protein [Streptomyces rhizosphaerihabitans]